MLTERDLTELELLGAGQYGWSMSHPHRELVRKAAQELRALRMESPEDDTAA